MKRTTVSLALSAALLAVATANASEFDGGYVGADVGFNRAKVTTEQVTSPTNPSIPYKTTDTFGLKAGYGWDVSKLLLGVDIFADINGKKTHDAYKSGTGLLTPNGAPGMSSNGYGLDVKVGLPLGDFLPYIKGGVIRVVGENTGAFNRGNGLHGAVGLEYKLAEHWSVGAEWSTSAPKDNGAKLTNMNYTLGVNYYFGTPPAPVAPVAAAPVVEEKPVAAPPPPPPPPKEEWKTTHTDKPVRIEGANFAFDSAKLKAAADGPLNEVLQDAKNHPEVTFEVDGHTDNIGKRAHNQKLSERRAEAVKEWLVKHGVAADRITTAGFADTKPVASNKTKEGRASNRRVEVFYHLREEKRVRVQ